MDTFIIDGSDGSNNRDPNGINPITLMPNKYTSREWMLRNSNMGIGYSDPKLEKKDKAMRRTLGIDAIKKVASNREDKLLNKSVSKVFPRQVESATKTLQKFINPKGHLYDFGQHVHPGPSLFADAQDVADVRLAEDPGKVFTGKFIGYGAKFIYHGAKTLFGIPPSRFDNTVDFILEEASMAKGNEMTDRLRKLAGVEFKNGDVRRIDGKADIADYRDSYSLVRNKDLNYKTGNASYDGDNKDTIKAQKKIIQEHSLFYRLRKAAGVESKDGQLRRIKGKADAADNRPLYSNYSLTSKDYKTGNPNYDHHNRATIKARNKFFETHGLFNMFKRNALRRAKGETNTADRKNSYSNYHGTRKNYRTGNSNYDSHNSKTVQTQQRFRKRIGKFFSSQFKPRKRKKSFWPFPFKFADGGLVNDTTLSYVGEDGPEAIIPLGSKRRQRGLDLWNQAGAMLGVQGYANGAIVGGKSAGSAKKKKKTAVNKTESKGKTSVNHNKTPAKVSVGNISINVKGNDGGSGKNVDLLQLLKAQKGQVSDELCSIIADAVEGAYKNIPVA